MAVIKLFGFEIGSCSKQNIAMRMLLTSALFAAIALQGMGSQPVEIHLSMSGKAGGLSVPVTYYLWLPPGEKPIRGIIIHQHGCGDPAARGGETAAFDLHWQALAEKHQCALLGSSYQPTDNCSLWSNPDRGSSDALQKALGMFAEQTSRPEIASAPWALWGHSGGAIWAFAMMQRFPGRTIALFMRSGLPVKFDGENEQRTTPPVRDVERSIPIMVNVEAKEKADERFGALYRGSQDLFRNWRAAGALIGFAADPRTLHECGNSRYLAIPFFDSCLKQRLPRRAGGGLRPMSTRSARFGDPATGKQVGSTAGPDEKLLCWLPDKATAAAWVDYVAHGEVTDESRPDSRPELLTADRMTNGDVFLTWRAKPDFESGIREFQIFRDRELVGTVPSGHTKKVGIPQFQELSYHDTPELPLAEMKFIDRNVPLKAHRYTVVMINGSGLASKSSKAERVP